MNKLAVYGVLGKQEEAQLLAEIKLHPDLPITSETKRDITESFAGKGISVLCPGASRGCIRVGVNEPWSAP